MIIRWGVCIPLACTPNDVIATLFVPGTEELTSIIQSNCDSGGFQQPSPATYALLALVVVLLGLTAWGTLIDKVSSYQQDDQEGLRRSSMG